jgi:hypothetical protein
MSHQAIKYNHEIIADNCMGFYASMQEIIDFIFGSDRWYRKLVGGKWHRISVPLFDASTLVWIRAHKLKQNLEWTIEVSEDYNKSKD